MVNAAPEISESSGYLTTNVPNSSRGHSYMNPVQVAALSSGSQGNTYVNDQNDYVNDVTDTSPDHADYANENPDHTDLHVRQGISPDYSVKIV
jgi:hypothetical protein